LRGKRLCREGRKKYFQDQFSDVAGTTKSSVNTHLSTENVTVEVTNSVSGKSSVEVSGRSFLITGCRWKKFLEAKIDV
jgi:hypothetical protein